MAMVNPDQNVAFGQMSPSDAAAMTAARKRGIDVGGGSNYVNRPVSGASDAKNIPPFMVRSPQYASQTQNATAVKPQAVQAPPPPTKASKKMRTF